MCERQKELKCEVEENKEQVSSEVLRAQDVICIWHIPYKVWRLRMEIGFVSAQRLQVLWSEDWEVGKGSRDAALVASGSLHRKGEKIQGDKGKINVTKVIV